MTTATIRITSADEIAAQAGGQTPFLLWPERDSLFAERAMRLRQLASGHAMGDFLAFVSALAQEQQAALTSIDVPLPDAAHIDRAANAGAAPLPAADWPRDAAWRPVARTLARSLQPQAPPAAREAFAALATASDDWLERQADCLLTGVMQGLELATSAVVAAALQVYWTHLVLATRELHSAQGQAFGPTDDPLLCPCCGSRPLAGITRHNAGATGQRYLVCGLCAAQWHLPRGRCAHCASDKHVAYHSLTLAGDGTTQASDDEAPRAAQAAVQAETCDDCNHYLKLLHSDRDPMVEPVADDLASLTLDLLVSEQGKQRHGVNLMLLFGAPDSGGG